MAPQKQVPSPPAVYTPTQESQSLLSPNNNNNEDTANGNKDHEAKLKAEARAYALSGGKRKANSSPNTNSNANMNMNVNAPNTSTPSPQGIVPQQLEELLPPSNRPEKTAKIAHVVAETSSDDDDYERFVKSLGLLDDPVLLQLEDDEEFLFEDDDEDDDEDDEEDDEDDDGSVERKPRSHIVESTPTLSSPLSSATTPLASLPEWEPDFYKDLEEELGSLLEEDLEAAVTTLLTSKSSKPNINNPTTPRTNKDGGTPSPPASASSSTKSNKDAPINANTNNSASATKGGKTSIPQESPATPLREAARQSARTQVTYQQSQQLRRLMTKHYQLLMQQGILAVRAAQTHKLQKNQNDKLQVSDTSCFLSGETSDDLAEILDGAVGMLQDLDQNRKDAIRNSIQLEAATEERPKANNNSGGGSALKGRRSLLSQFRESEQPTPSMARRLTRSAFSKTLQLQGGSSTRRTAFDIPGLAKLKETFETIDKSVGGVKGITDNILEVQSHADACRMVLRKAGANLDDACIPATRDLSLNFCDPMEYLGEDFEVPCNEEQQLFLRRNRNLFSSGEDNLVLRGVNLYGEKQWILIADRYLPDRSVNIISQRYSKLCVMLYKAHGIDIDPKGNLIQPPKLESVDDIDEVKVTKLGLSTVEPPAILNVHRWSLEEDLTLLKAVPLMGHMWAELGARLIPHRDRGHLRKRYQVLERRVKATVTRSTKMEIPSSKSSRTHAIPVRKTPAPVKLALKTNKPLFSVSVKPPAFAVKKQAPLKTTTASKPPMSIEKAAASLAFLRPPRPVVPVSAPATDSAKPSSALAAKVAAAAAQTVASHPGASIPATKPLPKGPAKRATLALVKGPESHLRTDLSETRTAFEQLVEGTSEEWSQMSRMKKMLENDAESHLVLVADAISQMAKTPNTNPDAIKLPQMHLDNNSLSGLSVLQPSYTTKPAASLPKGPGISIMASVMERTSKSNESNSNNSKESDSKMLAPTKKETQKEFSMESPRKRMPSRSAVPSTPTLTPKGGKSNFFSMAGTPIGLSPGFRMSPNMRNNALSLTPNVPYSSAPNSVMRFMNDGHSGDGFEFCNFEISEESRQELDVNGKAGSQADPTPPPLTPSKNSLMFGDQTLMGGDFDAISALQSLSNSPARGLLTRKPPEEPASRKSENKSLFAKVVGGIKEKDPSKKKLQF